MSEVTEPVSSGAVEEPETRRSMLRRVTLAGAAVFTTLAGWGTDTAAASNWLCCNLYYPNTSQWCNTNGYGNFLCPSGWSKRSWYCCQGVDLVGCGECVQGGTTCDNATSYKCSYGWI